MKISIIIPIYNVEKYIARCLDSILNQTLQDFEIVIINDCTPDKSMDIIHEYAKKDSRFSIYENEKNMGSMWTRMVGYTSAKGDYFVFCDSDDYLPKESFESLYNTIIKTGADIVIGNDQIATDSGFGKIRDNKLSYGNTRIDMFKSLLSRECTHSLCGKIYTRSLFVEYTYDCYKNSINSEDMMLYYQLSDNVKKVYSINATVYYYYMNVKSAVHSPMTDKKLREMLFGMSYINNLLFKYTDLQPFYEKANIYDLRILLKANIDKRKILKCLKISNIDSYFTYTKLAQFSKGWRLIYDYMLFNLRFVRCLRISLTKINSMYKYIKKS